MAYHKKVDVSLEGGKAVLHVTDDRALAWKLREAGEAVLIWLHDGNGNQDFSEFLFAVEDPEDLDPEYVEKVYRRLRGMPWRILETERCLVRETTPEDVEAFYDIYSHPSITKYMEGLYPEKEREKQYIREYIASIYAFYGYGVWTVLEKETDRVIGRAGVSYREGYEDPELGFIIGVPWQRKGYAREVCEAILKYGWEYLGFERVQAMVETQNAVSLHLCERLGFLKRKRLTMGDKEYFLLMATRPECYGEGRL